MSETRMVQITVYYINGEIQQFQFESETSDQSSLASRIQKMLNADKLMLELEDKLVIIPMQNVQRFEISPSPLKTPDTVIKGVRLLENS